MIDIDGLEFSGDGDVARLTFARPDKHNAISFGMWSAIPEVVAAVEHDPAVKVLLVTGAGDNFSAGADIGEFRDLRSNADGATLYDKSVYNAVQALAGMAKPSVAMIRGNCIGGGCQLATACDFRFAADGARFGITPSKLGIVYEFPSTKLLVSLIGPANARYFLLSGELIDSTRAREIGLVNETFAAEALAESTMRFVQTLCSRSQFAVRGMNRIIGKIAAGAQEPDEEVDRIRAEAIHGEDYAEGVAAFLERRPPRFTYR